MTGAPAWVVEYVLGFGLVPSSNIAQRFSHALLWILCSRIDADMETMLDAETLPERVAYIAERRLLGPNQARLFAAHCYTDDPIIAVVGVEFSVCVVGHVGRLMHESGAALSNGAKMQIGSTIKWNGMYFNSYLVQVIVPPHKALRAISTLLVLVHGGVVLWRVYQALVGLLGHIRYALGWRRMDMYGMYAPFHAPGARGAGPEERVIASVETVERSALWVQDLTRCPGIFCAEAVLARCTTPELSPTQILEAYSAASTATRMRPWPGPWWPLMAGGSTATSSRTRSRRGSSATRSRSRSSSLSSRGS